MKIFLFLAVLFVPMTILSQTIPQPSAAVPPIEPGVSHELAKWRAAHYSDVRYRLNLTLEKMSPVLKGTMEIRVGVRTLLSASAQGADIPPIVLDWREIKGHENLSNISNVTLNGVAVSSPSGDADRSVRTPFEERDEHLIFREGVKLGENVIKLDFTSPILTSGSAITRYIDKEDGSEYIYSLFVPSDASTAFPVFDQPDLKARFELELEVPRGWEAVANTAFAFGGDIDCEKKNPCGTVNHFNTTKPISTYVFAFAAGPFERVSEPPALAGGTKPSASSRSGHTIQRPANAASTPPANAGGSDKTATPTSIYVRKSQAEKFKPHAAEVFRLNREAIKYFEEYFDYKFPFPKYDLVLIPEFPFGGMEHAGTTFLREASIIFPQEPTRNDHISRALLIFHEASHQWFGDTVTMRWFDDLWLKEGFATFTAYKAMEKIMPNEMAWKVFYERVKQAAYQTDSTKGTTPIYQAINNLSAAKSAYGAIVYNKAPAFLRQAEFYLGEDKFQTAVRTFLKKHEFGNAGWEDLVREFENVKVAELRSSKLFQEVSERDKIEWERFARWSINSEFVKFWVTIPGMSVYRIKPSVFESDGLSLGGGPTGGHTIFMKDFTQTGTIENYNWLQDIKVLKVYANGDREVGQADIGNRKYAALPDEESKGLRRGEFTFSDAFPNYNADTVTPKARNPLFVFPNYQDYGYGIFLLDEKSRDYVLKNIQDEKDPFLRSMMWGALWDSVREGELDPSVFIETAIRNLPTEQDETMSASIAGRVGTALNYYVSDKTRAELALRIENVFADKMRTAPTLGQRITFYRAFLNVAASEEAIDVFKAMIRSEPPASAGGKDSNRNNAGSPLGAPPPANAGGSDIPLKTKDKFDIVTRLLILGDPEAPALLAELEKTETGDDAKRYAYAARAGIATAENKAKYWNDFVNNKEISESWIEAAFGPWNSIRHSELTLPYLQKALQELPNLKRTRKIFFINNWLAAFIGGQGSEEALAIVNKFLADNPTLDKDLRLKILENVDVIERAVKIRAKNKN